MTELHIGTGGWAYFSVPGMSRLKAYSRAFNFVEVNSTFYEPPTVKASEGGGGRLLLDSGSRSGPTRR